MHDPRLLPASFHPPTSPVLSYLKLSWAAQRAWLCVTPCQVLLETVRWQPPSLSAAPCPLRGWGGAIALHPPAPQRCDRKAWLAVTRPRWRGTLRRGEETRKREGTQVVSEQLHGGVILSIQQDLKSGWGWWGWGSVCVCVRPRWKHDPSSGILLGHITYMVRWQRWPWMRLDGLVGEKVA